MGNATDRLQPSGGVRTLPGRHADPPTELRAGTGAVRLRRGTCIMNRPNGTASWRSDLLTLLRGVGMGVVELVPGVSAGTLALILGFYERLVGAIAALVEVVRALLLPRRGAATWREQVRQAWRAVPWRFVLVLGAGMGGAPLLFSHVVGGVLNAAPHAALAFFSGVVLVAVVLPLRSVGRWRVPQVAAFLLAGTGAVVVLGLPVQAGGEPALWFLGLSGVAAAAVMVLPGVSGAFVLLVLGPYPYLIGVIRGLTSGDPHLVPLIVFQAGVLIGMGAVSKALSWLLQRARGITMAALSGLMLGSLRRLWPFLAWPDGAAADHLPLHAIPKVPLSELAQVPGAEHTVVLLAALAGAALAALGVAGALRHMPAAPDRAAGDRAG